LTTLIGAPARPVQAETVEAMSVDISTTWPGLSGVEYKYWIYPIGTAFTSAPGNYIFAKKTGTNAWTPVYIGQTGDFSERFENHHKMACIAANGATHIHVHPSSPDPAIRNSEESDIIARFGPPCND
jgi:hypothetical protein